MPYETTTYRRDELYKQVWARPMREVAREYGISDVALANACRKLNVPRPSRGYWARKAAGHEVSPAPLPALKPNESAEYQVSKWVSAPPSPEEAAFRARPEFQPRRVDLPFTIEVQPALERPHRLVAATLKALRKGKPDRDGLCSVSGVHGLPVTISPGQADRAARFFDALLKAIEKAGYQVRPWETYERRARFIVEGEEIEFSMRERLLRSDHVPTAEDKKYPSMAPKWDFRPSGELRFKIVTERGYGSGMEWQDGPQHPLESRLNAIFLSILQAASNKKAQAAMQAARAQLQAEEERRRWELEARRREEQRQAEALVEQAHQWQRAQLLRQFVGAVRKEAIARYGNIEPGSSADVWLKRVSAVAERLDPIPALFGPPEAK